MRNTRNYQVLPFNPKLKERAKNLRKAGGNLAEVLLWNQLKNGQLLGLDFDRQKIIGNYIVDFYCAEQRLIIEVDGNSHDDKEEYDAQRDAYLMGLELSLIHILDTDVKQNLSNVMKMLFHHCETIKAMQASQQGDVEKTSLSELQAMLHEND